MRFKIKIFTAVFLLKASCTAPQASSENKSSVRETYKYIDAINDGETVSTWVDEILSFDYVSSQFTTSEEPIQNVHYPNQVDTIKLYKTAKSEVNIYVTPEKTLLLESELSDSDVTLSGKIKIGVTKEVVFEVLNQKFANDTLKIREPDGYGVYFELFFKNDRLNRIYFKSFID